MRKLVNIFKEIERLQTDGIIDKKTAAAITNYYHKKSGGVNLLLIVFGILGSALIGAGIMLLVAHNWDKMGHTGRTAIALLPLIIAQCLAGYALMKKFDSVAWCEGSALFLIATIGSSIAIISQTYNLGGDFSRFMLSWMLLALPVVYLLRSTIGMTLYWIGCFTWARSLGYTHGSELVWFWILFAAGLPLMGLYLYRGISLIRTRFFLWVFALALFITIFYIIAPSATERMTIMTFAALFSLYALIGDAPAYDEFNLPSNPFAIGGFLGVSVLGLLFTVDNFLYDIFNANYAFSELISGSAHTAAQLFFAALIIAIIIMFALRVYHQRILSIPAALFFPITVFTIAIAHKESITAPLVIMNLYVFMLGIFTILLGFKEHRIGRLNTGLLLITALMVIRFFDESFSFEIRGMAFMALGLLFFACNFYIVRRKRSAS